MNKVTQSKIFKYSGNRQLSEELEQEINIFLDDENIEIVGTESVSDVLVVFYKRK